MATPGSTGTINLTEKADPKVMERFKQKSVTEGLFSNEYSWEGNATVKFPSIDTVPLNDYNQERIDGGSRYGSLINLGDTWQEHTVKERKSFMFAIDETYNTQQMQIKRASQCLKRELDEVVIRYVDKYRIRKMAAAGTSANHAGGEFSFLRHRCGFGIMDTLNLSDAQGVFRGFLQAAWRGSRMMRKRGSATTTLI